jgi:hypothetical protein
VACGGGGCVLTQLDASPASHDVPWPSYTHGPIVLCVCCVSTWLVLCVCCVSTVSLEFQHMAWVSGVPRVCRPFSAAASQCYPKRGSGRRFGTLWSWLGAMAYRSHVANPTLKQATAVWRAGRARLPNSFACCCVMLLTLSLGSRSQRTVFRDLQLVFNEPKIR